MSRLSTPGRALAAGALAALSLAAPAHAANVQLFDVPTNDANLRGIAAGSDGALYFTERKGLKLGRITTAGAITERAVTTNTDIGDNGPDGITATTDGKIWFYSDVGSTVYRFTPGTSALDRLDLNNPVDGLGAAPSGGLWATYLHGDGIDADDDALLHLDSDGHDRSFAATYGSGHPLALSPDGTAWFAGGLGTSAQLKRITSVDTGQISNTPFTLPGAEQTSSIAFAPGDPNPYLTSYQTGSWFSSDSGGAIGHYAGGGVAMTAVKGVSGNGNSVPRSMVAGPDGALWWAEKNGIGRLDPATGKVTEGGLGSYDPRAIAFGADGRLWFVDAGANKVGAIAIDGTLFPPPALPPAATPAPAPVPPTTQALAPEISLTVAGQKLKTVRSRKAIPVTCALNGPGICSVKLTVSSAVRKKLKLASATLGSAKRSYAKAGKATLTVKLSTKVLSGLKRAKGSVVVKIQATSSGPSLRPRTNVRELTLRR